LEGGKGSLNRMEGFDGWAKKSPLALGLILANNFTLTPIIFGPSEV
jgi:hypothetical protein